MLNELNQRLMGLKDITGTQYSTLLSLDNKT